jgi:solute carrier family 25 (mitochondrial oxoglutarate transporter), member 11
VHTSHGFASGLPRLRRLTAALLRQATYTTTRLGVYNTLEEYMTGADGTPPPFLVKAGIGMTAGAVGAVVGTPSEVALIRMMSDGRLPPEQRRGYRNVFDALRRVVVEEGVLTLWRGTGPTVLRAMALNAAQLASYSQAKEVLVRTAGMRDGVPLHLAASLCSGFIATAVSLPVDITKTKIQTMKTVNGVPEYRGAVDVLTKTVQREGFFRLWKGCASSRLWLS